MPETSLIPSVVNLARYFSDNFPSVNWFPDWYMGNPFYYLIGPVIPLLLTVIEKLSVQVELEKVYLGIIIFSSIIGGYGLYLFLRKFRIEKNNALIAGLFYILFPAVYTVLIYQNGLKHIAIPVFPYLLIFYRKYLINNSLIYGLVSSVIISVILLINSAALITVFISLFAFLFSVKGKEKPLAVFRLFVIILIGITIATFWYSSGYWLILLTNPSIGGLPFTKLLWNLINGILQFAPLIFAVVVVNWKKEKLNDVRKFSLIFFFSYVFLSLIRFISDPDFYMDWTGFVPELHLGTAFLIGNLNLRKKIIIPILLLFGLVSVCVITYISDCSKLNFILFENKIHCNTNYKTQISETISKNVSKNERIFLSGSSVFWFDERLQVRGGNDSVSVHEWWGHGAYQIREGQDASLTANWLRIFGASYILVHDSKSLDPYHDFKNTKKYADSKYFTFVSEQQGNYLYKVKNSSVVRLADSRILNLKTPAHGADKKSISLYSNHLRKSLEYSFNDPNEIKFKSDVDKNEVISLAITYDSNWKVKQGNGKLLKDIMGNIIIKPARSGNQEIKLTYESNSLDFTILIVIFILFTIVLIYSEPVYKNLEKIILRFPIGIQDDENTY